MFWVCGYLAPETLDRPPRATQWARLSLHTDRLATPWALQGPFAPCSKLPTWDVGIVLLAESLTMAPLQAVLCIPNTSLSGG